MSATKEDTDGNFLLGLVFGWIFACLFQTGMGHWMEHVCQQKYNVADCQLKEEIHEPSPPHES